MVPQFRWDYVWRRLLQLSSFRARVLPQSTALKMRDDFAWCSCEFTSKESPGHFIVVYHDCTNTVSAEFFTGDSTYVTRYSLAQAVLRANAGGLGVCRVSEDWVLPDVCILDLEGSLPSAPVRVMNMKHGRGFCETTALSVAVTDVTKLVPELQSFKESAGEIQSSTVVSLATSCGEGVVSEGLIRDCVALSLPELWKPQGVEPTVVYSLAERYLTQLYRV